MSAMYAGITPSLPSCNPNACRTDERPVQLTRTDGHVTRTDRHVNNPALNCKDRKARITCARLPIHNIVSFLCKGLNEHLIEALVLLSRPTPWCVAPY